MSECHRSKILLKGIMIVFKTKGLHFVAFLMGVLGCLNVNQKTCWLTKSKDMNKF